MNVTNNPTWGSSEAAKGDLSEVSEHVNDVGADLPTVVEISPEQARGKRAVGRVHARPLAAAPVVLGVVMNDSTTEIPAWCKPGTPVWYSPHAMEGAPRYLGMIEGEPRMLGDTPVVRVGRMERAYGRAGVAAAAVFALKPAETQHSYYRVGLFSGEAVARQIAKVRAESSAEIERLRAENARLRAAIAPESPANAPANADSGGSGNCAE